MNEMIPKPNPVPVEISPDIQEEPVFDPDKYTVVTELSPDQLSIEIMSETLHLELKNAVDYGEIMNVLEAAVAQNGHQTVETALLVRYNKEPNDENKFYLGLMRDIAKTKTIQSRESLKEPDFEGLGYLLELVNKYTEEDIRKVADIIDPAEGSTSPERLRMKDDIAPLYKLACKLRWESKAALDVNRSQYPEFWRIFDKFEAMHRAVGVINSIKGVRHDLTVKL